MVIEREVQADFSELQLPDVPNLYDILNLSLRHKDVICTFNWDPFLMQSQQRLGRLGVTDLPKMFYLHGNVTVGYCLKDSRAGLYGHRCSRCGQNFTASRLLYPVAHKNYQDEGFIEQEWKQTETELKKCLMFTVFGYSAPHTDQEAVSLLNKAWQLNRSVTLIETELIGHADSDDDKMHEKWKPFIHNHHYDIRRSFYDSWITKFPRRTIEAFKKQYLEIEYLETNPVPQNAATLYELVRWFDKLRDHERIIGNS